MLLGGGAFPTVMHAQVDVIRGRVLSMEGDPLPQVQVTATSIPGGVTRTARTDSRGAFQILFPGGQGDYMMGYALVGFAFRRFEIKRTADQDVLIADARLQAVQLDPVTVAVSVQQRVPRGSRPGDIGGTEQTTDANDVSIAQQGNLAALAASLPGVQMLPGLDGGPDGFSVLGLGADQNVITLNGITFEGVGLPRDATIAATLSTSPFDPGRGGFSGAQLDFSTGQGSNWRTRGLSVVLNAPQLMWTDRAARSLGSEFSNVSIGGLLSGPIRLNHSFYTFSYQLGRQSRENVSILTTDAVAQHTTGLASDSLSRFLTIIQERGVPITNGAVRSHRIADDGSFSAGIEIYPPNAVSGSAYSAYFNGAWGRQSPVGGSALSLPTAAGQRTHFSGSAQLRQSGYYGMLLTETVLGVSAARTEGAPFLQLPSGRVRVNSLLSDGSSGVQTISFGGNQGFSAFDQSLAATLQNTLSWFDDENRHRVKLTSELRLNHILQNQSSNLLGTYTFNSLEELEEGRPASYSRMLTARERSAGLAAGSIAIGDSYRRTEDVQFQYGLRVDANRFLTQPTFNPLVAAAFGDRNDNVPRFLSVSPRIGFSWVLGTAPEVGAFAGAARTPRAVLRGGVGVFANNASVGQLGSALDNTGLPDGAQQLSCSGDATPVPDWQAFANSVGAIPTQCADGSGGTVFSNAAPNVVMFAKGYRPQRSVRANFSVSRSVLDARYTMSLEATYALNLNQQQTVDRNFDPTAQFSLAEEGHRPVFVRVSSIVPTTGAIASRDARVTQQFARVSELRSDLRSQSSRLMVRLAPIIRTSRFFRWDVAYTYSNVREQYAGFNSTAGNPLHVAWSPSAIGRHQVNYRLRFNLLNALDVSWNGEFRSGAAFTPMIAGDVNGDGSSNDRAFIPNVSGTAVPVLRSELKDLISQLGSNTARCLERQFNTIAERNSCRGPWSSTASLNVTLDRVKFHLPPRTALTFSVTNPLGAADLALHGSGKLKGWGQTPSPDQALFYVRGFDAEARQFRYEVNRRFGQTRPQFMTLRSPVILTVAMRVDFGAVAERQSLLQQLDYGRRIPGTPYPASLYRRFGPSGLPNPMTAILRAQDTLQLTAVQADSIASMSREYAYRVDSLWTLTSQELALMPTQYDEDEAYARYTSARRHQVELLVEIARAISGLLTQEQLRRLPINVLDALDPRYLYSIRDGSGLYVGGQRRR